MSLDEDPLDELAEQADAGFKITRLGDRELVVLTPALPDARAADEEDAECGETK